MDAFFNVCVRIQLLKVSFKTLCFTVFLYIYIYIYILYSMDYCVQIKTFNSFQFS